MKISVITPSIRKEGLGIVKKALEGQTFKDFEWLISTPFHMGKHFTDVNMHWVEDDFEFGFWTLNRTYNRLFREAKGELLVSLQDWVYVNPDGLKKFWDNYQAVGPKTLISGVGDQYEKVDKWGKPEIKIWSDPRHTEKYGSFYECMPSDIEWNWAMFPRIAVFEAGGMDEKLDFLGFGGDQLQMGERLDMMGYKSYLDQTNESFTIRHDRSDYNGQANWDENHILFNGKYDKRKLELIETGEWPVLHYLNKDDII